MSDFGERLKSERVRLGYNQEEMGTIGGVARNAQANYENGKRLPDAGYLMAVMAAGVDGELLFNGTQTNTSRAGKLSGTPLSTQESSLVYAYRQTAEDQQPVLLQVCDAMAAKYQVVPIASPAVSTTHHPDNTLAQRLRIERARVGLTAEQLINKNMLGIDLDSYRAAENDEINPLKEWTGLEFAALAALGLDIQYILLGRRADLPDLNTIIETHSADIALLRNVLQAMASLEDADPDTIYTPEQKADAVIAVLYSALSTNSTEITPCMVISALAAAAG